MHMLNIDNLTFPLSVKDVAKFEQLNPTISVNILCVGDLGDLVPLHVTKHHGRPHHANLFILEDEDEDGNDRHHYVAIRNMSRLVAGRTKHTEQSHVCNYCLHPFVAKETLERHIPHCTRHPPQQVVYPDPTKEDECTVKFRNTRALFHVPFYLVCDFEAFLTPAHENIDSVKATTLIDQHNVCGFACYRVSDYEKYETPPFVYSGPNVMDVFYEHIMNESLIIGRVVTNDVGMDRLTDKEQERHDDATECEICHKAFTKSNKKVRHHDHLTGKYIGPTCNRCNLGLRYPGKHRKSKRSKSKNSKKRKHNYTNFHANKRRKQINTNFDSNFVAMQHQQNQEDDVEWAEEEYEDHYFLPVVFHNLKSYDAHFVIKHFKKQYTQFTQTDKNGEGETTTVYDDISITPLNGEKYLSFQVGNLKFIDSFQFLSTSLSNLINMLKDKKDSGDSDDEDDPPEDTSKYIANFPHTQKYLGDHELVYAKGVYPYTYMCDRSKFAETCLPPIEHFYNTLDDKPLKPKHYRRAIKTWNHFEMQTLQDYHDHYLLTDVLLLADVFENFRNNIYSEHHLDPLHFITLPSLAWTSALKYTEVELGLITDPDMYLMVENNMRGGIATISHRHALANNHLVEGHDPLKSNSWITYLDANNLYGTAMSEPLPVGNFRFLDDNEIAQFDVTSIPTDSEIGYIIECDLTYPHHLHHLHNDYPMAPEHMTVTRDMLSDYALDISGKQWKPSQKLVPNLNDKTKYVCHYRNLQFYIQHGLICTKIHRVIAFTQEAWLQPWIAHCTRRRQAARTEFESDLAKLQANATFGKTMEQVRNRVNIRLIADPKKLAKAVSRPAFKQAEIINEDLTMVRGARGRVILEKPISVGFAILELSKLVMYRFYYEHLKPTYQDKCKLLFTDTDSFCCHIETEDLYADMELHKHLYDTSNFGDHPLYSPINKRVLGKFKSETGAVPPREFVGLRAKMYSLDVPNEQKQSKIRVKGIKKSYVRKNVRHQQFLAALQCHKTKPAEFRAFRSRNHILKTVKITKRCLDAFDDKRYILGNGITTLAYGHKDIARSN